MSIGRFQVVENLGSGAHSRILQIRRATDGKNYALKVVPVEDPEDDAKFVRQAQHEFRVGQMLDHKNLVKVLSLEMVKDWLFKLKKVHLLLEYVNGKTLDLCPPLSLPRLMQVFCQAADGMVHMHKKGVFHADLKPNNLMLGRNGVVKIIDFGLAHVRGEKTERLQGTPEYIAPETVKHGLVNERTDIYNFGATMYRMVTFRLPPATAVADGGDLPLDKKTFEKMLKPVAECNPGSPPGLCDLIHRCISFDAVQRPERMSVVQGELDFLVDKLVKSPSDRLDAMEW